MLTIPPTPLSITDIQAPQTAGPLATVIVTANLPTAVDAYHWYADGRYVGPTADPRFGLAVEQNRVVEIECIATRYAGFDGLANAPLSYSAPVEIEWNTAADDTDVDYYRIDHATGQSTPAAEDWSEIGRIRRDGAWTYRYRTAALADLTWHWLRVVPVGKNGNDGTALTFTPTAQHVRRPDAPSVATAFDDGTDKVTWSAA